MAFEIGSIWRRWDPHVHAPDSIMYDNYGGNWDGFIAALEGQELVKVIGVTDYMNIANYKKVRALKNEGKLENISLIFPNIEFRITPKTKDGRAINIHLLVSPDDPKHEAEIEHALHRLWIEFDGKPYSCEPSQLAALGRAVKPDLTSEAAALREGANQFKVEFDAFRAWLKKEGWLTKNSLVAVAASSTDGASGLQHDDGFKALRLELYRSAHIIFSGKPADREFWLGKSHDGEAIKTYGHPKPCLHGSDAHDLEKLFKPDMNRFCWIKADPTFEGLRQTIYEPGDRVWIGEEPPVTYDKSRTLKSVTFGKCGWFEPQTYPLNPGLVAIIGQKGMGKSAINDLVAYSAGSWQDTDKDSFVDRARPHIKGMNIGLKWGDDRAGSFEILAKGGASTKKEVRYLSQRFVERLCADHASSGELTREIEAVIFSYLGPTETLSAANFQDLRERRTSNVVAEQRRLQEELRRLHREISDLYARKLTVPERQKKIEEIAKEREGIVAQIPPSASEAEAAIAQQLQQERDALAKLIDLVAIEKERQLRLQKFEDRIAAFKGQIERFWSDAQVELKSIGIPETQWESFRPTFPHESFEPVKAIKSEIENKLAELEGAETDPASGTVRYHQLRVQELGSQTTADEAKRIRITELQNRIAALDLEQRRLRSEIEQIEGAEQEQLTALRAQRRSVYGDYFETLNKERTVLAELYGPLQKHLGLGDIQEKPLDFAIRRVVDVDGWVEKGVALFNQRKKLPYLTADDMLSAASEYLLPAWLSGDKQALNLALDAFLKPYGDAGATVSDFLKPSQTVSAFFDWLYSTDHIKLTYGLSYHGTPLENLSPGTKGIVLLILYLAMDKQDTRPLLIDQPEENLDNDSIFNLLATYFRKAKLRRQILLITHNPNLVVNTDADQVIIAQCTKGSDGLPSFTYAAGSLEDNVGEDSIRQLVCKILEGGAAAFQQRERRYALSA